MENKIQLESQNLLETDRSEIINVNTICRLCAAADGERFIGIFSTDGISNDLHSKINLYLPIKVSINDNMPLQLCLNCASTLLAWHELVVTTVEADKKFHRCHFINGNKHTDNEEDLEQIGADCIASDENEGSVSPIELGSYINCNPKQENKPANEEKSSQSVKYERAESRCSGAENIKTTKTSLCCDSCNKLFKTPIGLKRHLKKCNMSPDRCNLCSKTFERAWDLKRHQTSCNREEPNEHFDRIANLKTKTCKACDKQFESNTLLKKHVKDQHNVGYKRKKRKACEVVAQFFCDICKKGYTRKFDMERHRSKAHSECPVNYEETSTRKQNMALIRQCKFKNFDGKTYYKCDFCQRLFSQSYNLMRHRTIHTGVRAYFCHICGKTFRISNGLLRHINVYHHGFRNFKCEVCNKTFATRATKDEHMNIHNNCRPFVCDICGKCFRQKATLNVHKLFHTNQFKFLCSTCGKKFRRAQELKVHTWLHTGYKPYSCKQCPSVFRLGQELKRHIRVHQNVGNCICADCGSSFSQERYLKAHKKIHIKEIVPSQYNNACN